MSSINQWIDNPTAKLIDYSWVIYWKEYCLINSNVRREWWQFSLPKAYYRQSMQKKVYRRAPFCTHDQQRSAPNFSAANHVESFLLHCLRAFCCCHHWILKTENVSAFLLRYNIKSSQFSYYGIIYFRCLPIYTYISFVRIIHNNTYVCIRIVYVNVHKYRVYDFYMYKKTS